MLDDDYPSLVYHIMGIDESQAFVHITAFIGRINEDEVDLLSPSPQDLQGHFCIKGEDLGLILKAAEVAFFAP
jgi:hypothetical protein